MNENLQHFTVSSKFAGERVTVTAYSKLDAARVFLDDERISRVTPRARGASLCTAYRIENGVEHNVGSIYYCDPTPA